jgi:hypothetical protein
MAESKKDDAITQQPAANPQPSYKVVTGTEEWGTGVFDCLDGGLEANDNLCISSLKLGRRAIS